MFDKQKNFFGFLGIIFLLTFLLFWQVFIQNKIPLSANLLASFYNPWAQEKFLGWDQGIPNKPTGRDDLWIFYPQRTFTVDLLKSGEIPFWNPYSFTGNYHLGLSETGVFYPFLFLFLIFPQVDTWVLMTVFQPVIVGLGMYLFLKRIVVKEASVILGSLSFAFSGIVIVRSVEGLSVGHSLIWLPYVFWGIESFFQTKKMRYLWIILMALTFSMLAGWFQFTFYIFVFSLAYAIYRRRCVIIFVPFFIFPLITLFHTIPAFQALLDSPRSDLSGSVFSHLHLMPITHFFTLIFPDFWGNPAVYNYFGKSDYKESIMFAGVVPFIFFLISIFKPKKKTEKFFLFSILISLLLAIDNPVSRVIVSSSLPVFSSFLPNRIFLLTTFGISVLAAFGYDFLLEENKKSVFRILRNSLSFILVISLLLFLFFIFRVLNDTTVLSQVNTAGINTSIEAIQLRNSVIPIVLVLAITVIFYLFKNKYHKNIFFPCVVLILFLGSFIFGQKYIPFSSREFVYPKHPVFSFLEENQGLDRFMSVGYGHIVPSIPLQFGLYSPEGIGSMYIRRYGEFVRYMKLGDFGIPDKIAFDLEIYPKDFFYPQNKRLHRFLELTNVKYIVVDKRSLQESKINPDSKNFQPVWENEKWQIYQYKKSMPRIFVAGDFEVISDSKLILATLFGKSFSPQKIILEEDPGFKSNFTKGKVEVINYSPNRILVKTVSDNNSLLYLSDNYSKSFIAFVDNKKVKILRANYTFRAIPLDKGKHGVEIVYDKKYFLIGLWISVVVLTFSIISTFIGRRWFHL